MEVKRTVTLLVLPHESRLSSGALELEKDSFASLTRLARVRRWFDSPRYGGLSQHARHIRMPLGFGPHQRGLPLSVFDSCIGTMIK